MTDIVDRLLYMAATLANEEEDLLNEAAAEIDRLREALTYQTKERDRLSDALTVAKEALQHARDKVELWAGDLSHSLIKDQQNYYFVQGDPEKTVRLVLNSMELYESKFEDALKEIAALDETP